MSYREPCIEINHRPIGRGHSAYIIAELSANHRGIFEDAVALIEEAQKAGADAVKLQTYTADTLTIDVDSDLFRHGNGSLWSGRTLHDLYQEAYTPWDWQPRLKKVADNLGIALFSTPFDDSAVDFLESMDVPAYKIASFELVDTGLLRRIAQTRKPIILSTGMATLAEIHEAVTTLQEADAGPLALLKCTSAYPAPADEMNLRTIPHLAKTFGLPVGLSDHTLDVAVPVAAVTLEACIIEKHLTLSRDLPGPDSAFSLEPHEFRAMVEAVRTAEKALGTVHYGVSEREARSRDFRRSLFVVQPIQKGEPFTPDNVRSIRPAHGLPPRHMEDIIGRRARQDIPRGTPLQWSHVGERQEPTPLDLEVRCRPNHRPFPSGTTAWERARPRPHAPSSLSQRNNRS